MAKPNLEQLVAGLISDADRTQHGSQTLPGIVVRNRRKRAEDRLSQALKSRGTDDLPHELQPRLKQLAERWAAAHFADGFREIEQFEIECAKENELLTARQSGDKTAYLEVLERHYREQVINQFGRIEIRGIQVAERVLLDLDRVYVPLFLESELPASADVDEAIRAIYRPRAPVVDVMREHRRILIVGGPGSGKTTLIAWLASTIADGKLSRDLELKHSLLPLVVTVRDLEHGKLDQQRIGKVAGCNDELTARAFAENTAVVLVDGLDEAPPRIAGEVLKSLGKLVDHHDDLRVVVTSRPSDRADEFSSALPDFHETKLESMRPDEVDQFIRKWCLAAETSVSRDESLAREKAEQAADDLIGRLERSRAIQRLAQTPLLCTILCTVHRFLAQRIPERRVKLYEKCTDVLLYDWDAAKLPDGALVGLLDATQKRRLLGALARSMHEAKQTEAPYEQVVKLFRKELAAFDVPNEPDAIVNEIRDRSGLLVERRPGWFAFSHLTFQEYLTAVDWARTGTPDELISHYDDPWWHEVIVLYAGMDHIDSAKVVELLLKQHDDSAVFLAAQAAEAAPGLPIETREQVEGRISEFVPPKTVDDVKRLRQLGPVTGPILTSALQSSSEASEIWHILNVFVGVQYDPALNAIARLLGDNRSALFERDKSGRNFWPVGLFALIVLLNRIEDSELARDVLARAMGRLPRRKLQVLAQHVAFLRAIADSHFEKNVLNDLEQQIDDRLKSFPQETTLPTES